MTTSDKTVPVSAPEHPPPWRWEPGRIGHAGAFPNGVLRDATGGYILDRGDGDGQGRPPPRLSPIVAEQLRTAPEMETLLERAADLVHWLTPFAFAYAAEHPESNMPTAVDVDEVYRSSVDLLERLDEARKSGT